MQEAKTAELSLQHPVRKSPSLCFGAKEHRSKGCYTPPKTQKNLIARHHSTFNQERAVDLSILTVSGPCDFSRVESNEAAGSSLVGSLPSIASLLDGLDGGFFSWDGAKERVALDGNAVDFLAKGTQHEVPRNQQKPALHIPLSLPAA